MVWIEVGPSDSISSITGVPASMAPARDSVAVVGSCPRWVAQELPASLECLAGRVGVAQRILGHHQLLERLLGVRPDPERLLRVVDRVPVAAGDEQLPRREQMHAAGAVAIELALAVDPGVARQILQQVAAISECRSLGEEVKLVGGGGLGAEQQTVEHVDVDGDLVERESISTRVGGQDPPCGLPVGKQSLAKLGDVGLQRATDVLGDTSVGPQVVGELVLGHRPAARQQQRGQELLRLQTAEVLVLQ